VTLGVDAHKFTHTEVAVDGNGCELGTETVEATSAGHLTCSRGLSSGRGGPSRWRTVVTFHGDLSSIR